jgi:hypothetical protein
MTHMEAQEEILSLLNDASGMTIGHDVIFDLADSNGMNDLIKNSLIKDKFMSHPGLILKKPLTTLYMYDSSVIIIKVDGDYITIDWHESLEASLQASL